MAKEMLINVSEGEECRIALLDDGKLEELYMERTSSTSHVGNIYKGKVTNVEASIQAAFVDFGLGRNGFLHISDLMPTYFGRKGEDIQESVGKKMARRDRPPIQRCLRRGDEIIVQIIKEGIGTKGPTLSTYLSIPGRILVMMPGMGKMGVSKKIEDEEERRRLRTILDSLKPPKGVGFIIRTAGIGKSKAEIQRDLTYLSRLWQQIEKRESSPGPIELYTEGDLVARTVRDVFSSDVDQLIVDNKEVAKRVKEVIKITNPRTRNKVEIYEDPIPLFHRYGIEKDIEQMYSRHVQLPSGGSLVIDSTEAIVAIDVNSGKFRDHSDAEMTAFKTDMEAADEIPRQLKLRDLGGVIICDFIDLRYERHRRELEERLHENFKKDRAKTKVLRMSQFGIIEITRQRMRPSLKRSIYFDCPHCKGAGLVKTPESMSLDAMRKLAMAAHHEKVARIELTVCTDISFYLLNKKRSALARLEDESQKRIVVKSDATLGLDEMRFSLFDARDGLIFIEELGLAPQPPHTSQLHTRPAGAKGRQGGRDNRHGGQRGGRNQQGSRRGGRDSGPQEERHDDERDFDDAEDAIEAREERPERTPADDALVASIAPKVVREDQLAEPDAADADDAAEDIHEDESENVVEMDDGHSELGERPAGEWDRNYDNGGGRGRQRGGRNRGRDGGREGRPPVDPGYIRSRDGQRPPPAQQSPQQNRGPQQGRQQPPVLPAPSGNDLPEEIIEHEDDSVPGPGNELHPTGGYKNSGGQQNRGGYQGRGGQNRGGQNRDRGGHDNRGGQQGRGGQQNRGGQGGQYRGDPQDRGGQQGRGQQNRGGQFDRGQQNRDGRRDGGRDGGRDQQQNRNNLPARTGPQDGGAPNVPMAPFVPGAAGGQGPLGGPIEGGVGPLDEAGGKRRRRRRGGRRHRRRRERERLAREQAAATGMPYVPPPAEPGDQFEDDLGYDEVEGSVVEQGELTDRGEPIGELPAPQREGERDEDREEEHFEDAETAEANEPQPVAEAAEEQEAEGEEADEEKPAPKKKRGGRKPAKAPASTSRTKRAPKRTAPESGGKTTKAAEKAEKAAEKKAAQEEAKVVKTGSADKHLADDEPADPPPVSRPKRRYDLDAIDDDYD